MKNDEEELTDELTDDEHIEKVKKIIGKYNNKRVHDKISNIGLDPCADRQCVSCHNKLPNYLFFITPKKELFKKCAICFELDKEEQQEELDDRDDIVDPIIFMAQWKEWQNNRKRKFRKI
jgi:hypothetical protein